MTIALMKWTRPKRLRINISVFFFAVITTASNAQVSAVQSEGVVVKTDVASLCELVTKAQVVTLRYDYDPDTAELRELFPHGVGYTRKKDILLFGLQVKDYSRSGSGNGKGWRNFRVDKIKIIKALNLTFKPVRPNFDDHKFITEFACKNEAAFGR